ncbi:MAG: hypothetical protein A2233_03255 [Candidatus Kerfeldbacteria bacterium RIFOXYA2_FULL_38_24]|uniref:Uncharacterized protein n=1 Tax=Candidatus Kerfeldbacteria bacterium RIFOXYB2_FULL_38_14 TaxID=1798547 RepID=A0A1G2BE15_9BACT|nr:MAG: hypothetical protein A2233_03255 [Candidatus Kerfeldbacteria bacterium RIFOXYA2_FULL_38_24]OGY86437.1 MAG: hypothetical protein A2319_01295 [Candidatus Kerfeldbacteria bacterium RIFOXYB2_FULL_38_14]OGY88425.1 MAG: hypothetical protein A2458_03055 [Candidatus Kerfeldbacteria bacterium RIFOXYC2_FULL_38_9]
MKLRWQGNLQKNPRQILEQAGYHHFIDPNTAQASFIMRLGRGYYPRFHIYVRSQTPKKGELNLHLDQKHPSYTGQTKHSGEYESPQVQKELARLQRWIKYYLIAGEQKL